MALGPDLAERKIATVLFADLAGSTAVGERLDVEIHQVLMNAYLDAMREEAEATGGTVEQFVGDAVLAVFGVPVAREDDADRAVGAARAMVARLERLNETLFRRHGLEFGLRVGVNTGEVVLAAGSGLGRLAGDALNVGARLSQQAPVGGVLVSEQTAAASRRFIFEPIGKLELRGRTEPIAALEVVGETEVGRGHVIGRAPMVGRDHELGVLSSLWARVVGEGRPYLVTIFGVAGIGKSRLAEDFAVQRDQLRNVTTLFGRCRPYGEDAAFGAFAEILGSLAGIDDGDSTDFAVAKIGALVDSLDGRIGPPPEDAVEALRYSAGISGAPSPLSDALARQVRSAINGAWRWLLGSLAARGPVVVRVEDLHWADPAMLDLLEHLADRVTGPILFVCPARPTLLDSQPTWGSGKQHSSSMLLDPLSGTESRRLVSSLLSGGGLPQEVATRIIDRADGNPFFIEEIIRGLVDDGSIVRDGGDGWRLARDLASVEIPTTVQAVISARIDLLDITSKRALQCAAVVGRTFWSGALAHLLDAESDDVEGVLDELEVRGLVLVGADSALSGEREYRFKHAMVRDVAYDTLARRDRSALHIQVADWLSGAVEGRREIAGIQAHHIARAYDGLRGRPGAEDVAADLRERAFSALLAASDNARLRVALGQAKYFAREAGRLSETADDRSRAAEALGEAFFYGYEGDKAWRALREAIEYRLGDVPGKDPEIARLCARALQLAIRWPGAMQSTPDEIDVVGYLHLGMDHAPPGSEEAVRLLTVQGLWQHAYPHPGDDDVMIQPQESLRSAEQAVRAAAAMHRPDLESAALDAVTGCYIPRGLYSSARPATVRRLELIGDLHDLWEIGDTYAMQGWIHYHMGDYGTAFARCDEGYRRTVGEAPSLALHCLRWRTQARFRLGDWGPTRVDLALARDLLGDNRDDPPNYLSPMFAVVALIHEYRGEHGAADAVIDVLTEFYDRLQPADRDTSPLSQWAEFIAPLLARRGRIGEARRLLAETRYRRVVRIGLLSEAGLEVTAAARDWDAVPDLVAEARGIAAQGGLLALGAAADGTEGMAAAATGDYDMAIDLLDRGVAAFGAIGAKWDEARFGLALAETLADAGLHRRAREALSRCAGPLGEMSARREADAVRDLADALD